MFFFFPEPELVDLRPRPPLKTGSVLGSRFQSLLVHGPRLLRQAMTPARPPTLMTFQAEENGRRLQRRSDGLRVLFLFHLFQVYK